MPSRSPKHEHGHVLRCALGGTQRCKWRAPTAPWRDMGLSTVLGVDGDVNRLRSHFQSGDHRQDVSDGSFEGNGRVACIRPSPDEREHRALQLKHRRVASGGKNDAVNDIRVRLAAARGEQLQEGLASKAPRLDRKLRRKGTGPRTEGH